MVGGRIDLYRNDPLAILSPRPKIRLKSCPEMVPVQAITAKPSPERLTFAKKSPREFPKASRVQARSVLFTPKLMEKN